MNPKEGEDTKCLPLGVFIVLLLGLPISCSNPPTQPVGFNLWAESSELWGEENVVYRERPKADVIAEWETTPQALKDTGPRRGFEQLKRSVVFRDRRLGYVTDIRVDHAPDGQPNRITIVAEKRSVALTPKYKVESRLSFRTLPPKIFDEEIRVIKAVDLDRDGELEYLVTPLTGAEASYLVDGSGDVMWTIPARGGIFHIETGSFSDVEREDIAVAYFEDNNGESLVTVYDGSGRKVADWSDVYLAYHLEAVDLMGDERDEAVYVDRRDNSLTVRGSEGVLSKTKIDPPEMIGFAVTQHPLTPDEFAIVSPIDDLLRVLSMTGEPIGLLEAPFAREYSDISGTTIRFKPDRENQYAVVTAMRDWDRAGLYVYNARGQLAFHEVLRAKYPVLAKLPMRGGGETLLVGGRGIVYAYTPRSEDR